MKKNLFIFFSTTYFLLSSNIPSVFAQGIGLHKANKPGNIPIDQPIGNIVTNILQILFIIGGLGVLIFIVWGAMDWILAGGDKEKLAAARKKIMNSIIGLILLALSVFIVSLIGQVTGIDVFNLKGLPTLYQTPSSIMQQAPGAPGGGTGTGTLPTCVPGQPC